MNKKNIFLLVVIFMITTMQVFAQDYPAFKNIIPIKLNPNQNSRYINDSIRVFYTLDTLTGTEALKEILAGRLKENLLKKTGSLSLANNGFWLLFSFENNNSLPQEYYLELAYNRADLVNIYILRNNEVIKLFETGDVFRFTQRPIQYRNFVFPLEFKAQEQMTLLLNVEKRNTVDRFPLRVYTKERFNQHKDNENIIYGLFFGIILIIVFGSIGISFYMRMSMFAYYGLYTLSVGVFLLTSLGLTFQVFTPEMPVLNNDNLGFLIPISVFFMIKFCQTFFSTKKYFPRINKLYNILAINLLILILLWAITPQLYKSYAVEILNYSYVIIFSVFGISFLTAHLFRKINYVNAILFGLGYTASFVGIGYAILIDTGIVYSTLFVDSSLSIISGVFVEFIFLTSAMAVYIRRRLKYFDFNSGFRKESSLNRTNGNNKNGLKGADKIIIKIYKSKLDDLTTREKEVLQLISSGKTSQEIAKGLFVSIHTVQTHRKHIWKKLEIKSYGELIKIAHAFDLKSTLT